VDLAKYKGKVVLVVNVASRCGYTPQYTGLQKLYETYKDKGLVVLGFPANEFGAQEPGSDTDLKIFFSNTSRLAVFFQESSRRLSISRCTTKPRNMSCCRLNRLWPKGAPMVSDAQTTSCSELPERFANAGLTDEAPSRV